MEELLNKLIQRWWKPFDVKWISEYFFESVPVGLYRLCWKKPDYDYNVYSKRDLVSKESGLWQFCIKNKLVKEDDGHITRIINVYKDDDTIVDGWWNYHYWLMICSILDESDLEEFLLENIKL